ncbi:uncharacterized protein LOC106753959 [Vigna radiata var. radiata]|uniref:Uncharacterized protein LOC106753959 n=1 Tax=Vigna radiata var. radiata TaxID=3916 RepID=A0A1S3TC55_VIGRR|nr:uncharacterized protein LOC106753959 [Vigna radiata var. radiata]
MCPLRFILVFFSAALAAYFAWTTVRSSSEIDLTTQDQNNKASSNKDNFSFNKMIQNGFWVFVDMASGRYIWRNLISRTDVQVKSS